MFNLTVAAFEENTCSVLCKCNTESVVVIPSDEQEFLELVEETTRKQIRELTVPTSNLSATVRKKTSATDERESSTGMSLQPLFISLQIVIFNKERQLFIGKIHE